MIVEWLKKSIYTTNLRTEKPVNLKTATLKFPMLKNTLTVLNAVLIFTNTGCAIQDLLAGKSSKKKEELNINSLEKILKRIFALAIKTTVLAYIGFSIFSLNGCSKNKNADNFDRQVEIRNNTVNILAEEHNAQFLDCSAENILNNNIVFDSLVLAIQSNGGEYLLRAKIRVDCPKQYYAELKCSSKIAQQFKNTKSNYAVVAAKINSILNYNILAEADSLDGGKSNFNLGDKILFTGECLALVEIPPVLNAD